jgi:hypothetical protein
MALEITSPFQTIPTNGSGNSSPAGSLGDVSGLGLGGGLTQTGSGSSGAAIPPPVDANVANAVRAISLNNGNLTVTPVSENGSLVNGGYNIYSYSSVPNSANSTVKINDYTGTAVVPTESPANWDPKSLSPKLGSAKHDVVSDYWWTLTPKKAADAGNVTHPARLEAPCIILNEFKMKSSALTRAFKFYKNTADELRAEDKVGLQNIYGYYSPSSGASEDLNRKYILPYFADSYYDIQSSYSDFARQMIEGAAGVVKAGASFLGSGLGAAVGFANRKSALGMATRIAAGSTIGNSVGGSVGSLLMSLYALNAVGGAGAANLVKAITQAPRAGFVDQPLAWNTSVQKTFNVTFPLFNNIGDSSDISKNWQLIWELTYANSFNKATSITSEPPYFYEVTIPGQYYTPAAYVSNITVKNLGNQRKIDSGGDPGSGTIVPDAWLVSLTLVDFFVPSKNLMFLAKTGSKINAS